MVETREHTAVINHEFEGEKRWMERVKVQFQATHRTLHTLLRGNKETSCVQVPKVGYLLENRSSMRLCWRKHAAVERRDAFLGLWYKFAN
jgi:hypothetical protein